MNRDHVKHIFLCFLVLALFASPVWSQSYSSKLDYYNNVLVPQRGYDRLPSGDLETWKPGGFIDRKLAIMDVGNILVILSNGATLGYDRWGKCWEWPAFSGFTYRWCMAPLLGGIVDGNQSVASGTRGAARNSEEEFQPLPGYDAGYEDVAQNIGFALSDVPASWPSSWPVGALEPPTGSKGFKGVGWLEGSEGEIVATRESYFVVTDNDAEEGNLPNPLNVRVDIWGLQWDDFINQDYIIFRMNVTNIGSSPIEDFYIGMHDDPDTPEQGSQEWTDDFAAFIPPGMDVENYTDVEDALLANTAYLWDGDDQVQGLIASNVPWVGLKVLETPEDPANPGTQIGLTTMDVFEYSQAPQSEITEYVQLTGAVHIASPDDPKGVMDPINLEPHPEDWTQSPNTYGPDITYVFASGPFQLNPGESVPFALASIHGANKTSMLLNAMRCQTLWDAGLLAAEPPPQPIVRAIPGDHKVTLYWGEESELGIYEDGHVFDKQTGNNAFQGYRVFKSTDRGQSWGTRITDINGALQGYIPLAQYDIPDGIVGESTTRRFFHLGLDTGLKHYYVDQNVSNGFEYYYAVNAYDSDDLAIPPLENSIKTDPNRFDTDNTVVVMPQRPPSGVTMAALGTFAHASGISDVAVEDVGISILDETSVTGNDYVISIDAGNESYTVTNTTTSAVVMNQFTNQALTGMDFFDSEADNASIFDGIRLEMPNASLGVSSITGTNPLWDEDGGYELQDYWFRGDESQDFEIEFTAELYWAASYWNIAGYTYPGDIDLEIPVKLTNLTTGKQLMPIWRDRGSYNYVFNWDEDHFGIIQEADYDTYTSWESFSPDDIYCQLLNMSFMDTEPQVGDKITIINNHVLTTEDTYTIATTRMSESSVTKAHLEDIQAVPNPYIVSSRFETGAYGFQKELQFHQLPATATIRIYNMAGDFIAEIPHSGGSVARWNLQTYNGQEVAYGVYFFHVNAPNVGEHIGKFAIIK